MKKNPNQFTTTKQTRYINENGEYTNVYEEKVIERYNEQGYLYKNKTKFLKDFLDETYPSELSWADRGRLGRLEHEIKENQLLVYESNHVIKPHTIKTLSKILECSDRQTRTLINKCKKLNVLGEAKINGERYYLLNPRYKLHGNRISMIVWIVFQDYFRCTLPKYAYDYFLEDFELRKPNVEVIK